MTTYSYDLVGSLSRVDYANGMITTYEYDALNRLDVMTHYSPDETPENLADNDKLAEYDYTAGGPDKFCFRGGATAGEVCKKSATLRQDHPPTSSAQRESPWATRDDQFACPADNEPLDPVVTSCEMECN